ncbi:protein of unknown function DUF448 [Geobacter metallireducens RCH3]|uniref:RNA-binding protein YlxRQ, putative n=1 Tax=Geobacter metallireducens (strain ATCC 53774 / DSM 7210 / GS-15) TaxID=269799 RepID=Q39VA7_GEOMG|nr:DUF448 domain-containing protein [Geobacter metallireducens]ABB31817.1 RNA-binding protein YlxRQ, putative [Geobacter metallireducens GS-15]EHP89301.1 protein of unknown function DUF448 [Geobacter metallireducens RCH3]
MARSEPRRTCLGCRAERGKDELLRYVLDPEGTVVPDLLAKLPGRGAYTCFCRECVEKAATRKQFARAFKGEVRGATSIDLVNMVVSRLEERIASYLALANKAGKIVSGSDMVMEAMRKKNKIGLAIIAGDVSAEIGDKITGVAAREGIPCFRILDKDRIGGLLGKGLRSVVAIEAGGFVPPLVKELQRYGNFLDGGAVDEQDPRV